MLRTLRIKNLALIEDLTWELRPGFNILTGETGAGKSILIDGLNLLLGERADKTLIRTGEQSCAVEAELAVTEKGVAQALALLLEEVGAEPSEGDTLLLKRSFTMTGVNKQWINGSPVTLQALKLTGDLLVDVHGPHDHQSLLSTERQLEALDAYGRLAETRAICGEKFTVVQRRQAEHDALQMSEKERQQKLDRLRHQVKEIGGAQLKAGEDEQVERDYQVATHAQQLLELAATITQRLNEAEDAVLPQLAQVERALTQWEKLDPAIRESANLNRGAVAQIQELMRAVQASAERIDLDAGQLRELEERLNLIQALKRKYGPTLEEVRASGEESEKELRALEASDETRALKAQELEQARKDLEEAAQKLSAARKKVARPLSEKIQRELRSLGFKQASFQVELKGLEQAGRTGIDRIEFVFAPNPGEAPRPLRAIASSGEMARVMLAVKTTLAEVDKVPILIFDEVDANVGGETATQVGERLRSLGRHHQVLCITHLPQVAAQGEVHFRVEKSVKGGRTLTELAVLEGRERVEEVARMLGGTSASALALAQSLLKS